MTRTTKTSKSVTTKVIAKSTQVTSKSIYVPVSLREHVKTVNTKAGTRLAPKT